MPINYNLLRLEIERQAGNAIYAKAKPLIEAEFLEKKAEMLEYFDNHEVTEELQAGPQADGSVDTAHGGNLYSLIGFTAGEDPASAVRGVLDKEIRLNLSQTKREVRPNVIEFRTPVVIPTIAQVNEKVAKAAPLKWTSRAFTDLLEKGITGLNRYLFKPEGFKDGVSESGTAIEAKKPIRQGSMRKIRYVSDVLAKFRNSILGKE